VVHSPTVVYFPQNNFSRRLSRSRCNLDCIPCGFELPNASIFYGEAVRHSTHWYSIRSAKRDDDTEDFRGDNGIGAEELDEAARHDA